MLVFFVLVIGAYYWFREWHKPGYLWAMFINELGGRYFTDLEDNGQPFLYYARNFFTWRYPFWKYFIIPAMIAGWFYPSLRIRKFLRFNFLLVLFFALVISSSRTKLYWYDLPIYPFLSIHLAYFFLLVWKRLEGFLKTWNASLKQGTAVVLAVFLFALPLQVVYIHNVRLPAEWPWSAEEEERKQGFFLKDAMSTDRNLDDYIFCFRGLHNAHLNFYIKQLQLKNVQVQLKNNIDSLQPGFYIVVSQDEVREQLEKRYRAQKLDDDMDVRFTLCRKGYGPNL